MKSVKVFQLYIVILNEKEKNIICKTSVQSCENSELYYTFFFFGKILSDGL